MFTDIILLFQNHRIRSFMVEYKQVLYDLRITYNGPLVVEDFYAEIENWVKEKGYEKEPKKKMEHVTKHGKKIEWFIEIHRKLDELRNGVIVLRAYLDNVKEVIINKNGKKIRINTADAYINIDGFIQSIIHASYYEVKPIYYFIRALIDRYIYNFWTGKFDGQVAGDCHDLFKRIKSFFNVQKNRYE